LVPPTIEAAGPPETPLQFTSGERPLYGVYYAPRRTRPGAPVLVHCHSLGVEQLTTYRNETLLARAAAERGFPVFRFHARGHGDSAGDYEAVTLETVTEDARAAAAEARRRSGAARTVWLGIRFGAYVAAGALLAGDHAGLILWEPELRADQYFRKMLRGMLFSAVAHGMKPTQGVDEMLAEVERVGRVDVHGYYLHRRLVKSVAGIDLGQLLEGWKGPTLLVQVQARPNVAPSHAQLVAALERRGTPVAIRTIHEEPGWLMTSNPAWENLSLVRETVEWLDALA
jgi:pimeloyl-ACP methyl ester carboxylesterase